MNEYVINAPTCELFNCAVTRRDLLRELRDKWTIRLATPQPCTIHLRAGYRMMSNHHIMCI